MRSKRYETTRFVEFPRHRVQIELQTTRSSRELPRVEILLLLTVHKRTWRINGEFWHVTLSKLSPYIYAANVYFSGKNEKVTRSIKCLMTVILFYSLCERSVSKLFFAQRREFRKSIITHNFHQVYCRFPNVETWGSILFKNNSIFDYLNIRLSQYSNCY